MAMPLYIASNITPFAATAGAKTALNIIAGANQAVLLKSLTIALDGVTSSAVPATVDVCQSTQAGAGTGSGSPTIVQASGRTLAAQATVAANFSAEPTVLTPLEKFYVPQFMGLFRYNLPLGDEYETDFSGGTIKALAIRINVTANVNVLVSAGIWLVG
jgi:hypothetical protein